MEIEEFNEVITPLRPLLTQRARQLTQDATSAEDLVQEVMLKLWTTRHTLSTHPNIRALALTILRNKHLDGRRRQKLEPLPSADIERQPTVTPSADARSDVALVNTIVDHLPEMQRTIFRMKEIDGYSIDEIAQISGCSSEAIRQHLSRARRKIKEIFIRMTRPRL